MAWGAFTAASVAALSATGRFMFPNVLNEPPQQFKVGLPADFGMGVDERFKESSGVWIVRTADDIVQHASGFYVLSTTCTHLGCTPNYLMAEAKFKCPCHGSGFRTTGINFEGPAPRPLERVRVVLGRGRPDPGRQEPEIPVRARPVDRSRSVSERLSTNCRSADWTERRQRPSNRKKAPARASGTG